MRLAAKRIGCGLALMLCLGLSAAQAEAKPLPIVFVHGYGVQTWTYELFFRIGKHFRDRGHEFHLARIPATGDIVERTEILKKEIDRLVPQGRFILIGHSKGGIDSRLLIHKYRMGDRVAALITMATPHHGSALADWILDRLGHAGIHKYAGMLFRRFFNSEHRAARDLSVRHMRDIFNAEVTDDPRVRYFSFAYYIPEPAITHSVVPFAWWGHKVLRDAGQGPNDGLVSVESARWGEFQGAVPGDHFAETAPFPFPWGPSHIDNFSRVLDLIEQRVDPLEN